MANFPLRSETPFSLFTLVCLVIANMIGAGVFTTSGFSLEILGTPNAVIWAWIVGGIIAICGAIAYGQLIRQWPESGGEYVFLSRAIHPFAGFLGAWISLIAGFAGATAFAANGLGTYLLPEALVADGWRADCVAILAILAASALHGVHVRLGASAQNLVVMVKLALLLGFMVIGATNLMGAWMKGSSEMVSAARSAANGLAGGWPGLGPFASALVWISLSYSGFNAAVYVAEEAPHRERVVPRALWIGTVAVTLLYVGLNAIFVLSVPAALIQGKAEVAAIAARAIGGSWLEALVRAVIVLALWTSVLSMLMAGPRVLVKLAQDGVLPRFLAPATGTPCLAILVQGLIAILFVLSTTLQSLLGYLGLTLSLSAALCVACVLSPRRVSDEKRASTGTLVAASVFVVATLTNAAITTWQEPRLLAGTLITLLLGGLAYLLVPRWNRVS